MSTVKIPWKETFTYTAKQVKTSPRTGFQLQNEKLPEDVCPADVHALSRTPRDMARQNLTYRG